MNHGGRCALRKVSINRTPAPGRRPAGRNTGNRAPEGGSADVVAGDLHVFGDDLQRFAYLSRRKWDVPLVRLSLVLLQVL